MDKDRISRGLYWSKAWSIIEGCSPVSPGCSRCWSAKSSYMRKSNPNPKMKARHKGLTDDRGQWTGEVRIMQNDLDKPFKVRRPTRFAVWNDLFHEKISDSAIAGIFGIMSANPQHTFLVLTKRAKRMEAWFDWIDKKKIMLELDPEIELMPRTPTENQICQSVACHAEGVSLSNQFLTAWAGGNWPLDNVWLGVTAENQTTADERIPILLDIPASKRFVSVEPMLGSLNMEPFFTWTAKKQAFNDVMSNVCGGIIDEDLPRVKAPSIDWIVCGCESGASRRETKTDWIRNMRDQCVDAEVPFFLKQMDIDGKLVKLPELDGQTWDQIPGEKS